MNWDVIGRDEYPKTLLPLRKGNSQICLLKLIQGPLKKNRQIKEQIKCHSRKADVAFLKTLRTSQVEGRRDKERDSS